MRKLLIVAATVAAIVVLRVLSMPKLKHFTKTEFGIWYPLMSRKQLTTLDAFRESWGYPVEVSKADGSLGRHGGGESQHNVERWGEVRATDVFPKVPDGKGGYRYMKTIEERQRAHRIATQVGFTGIGIYTDTSPGNLLHVDTRESERVAQWSRVDGQYLGIQRVLA